MPGAGALESLILVLFLMDFSDHAQEQEQLLSLKKVYMILKQLQNQLHLKETNKLKERD